MQVTIEAILTHHGYLAAFHHPKPGGEGFHVKIENDPWMPLVIERHGDLVMVSHTFMQNGDVMQDPEIVFKLPTWEPVEITQHPLGIYRHKYGTRNGRPTVDIRFDGYINPLVRLWAGNLRQQGFTHSGTSSSLTHPRQDGR